MNYRRPVGIRVSRLALLASCLTASAMPAADPLGNAPIDPGYLTRVSFGSYSHWLQPWRGYLETMPATRFLDGLGIVLNTHGAEDDDQLLRMCARNGFQHVRIEIGWGSLDFDDETRINNSLQVAARLRAARRNGLRALVLLNGHHGAPCPLKNFERVVTVDAAVGARELTLDRTDGLIVGHSGLCNEKHYIAAEWLVIAIQGNKVTLSKPLAAPIRGGTKIRMATLKYAPFGPADSTEGRATLEGWRRYAKTIARFAAGALGTTGSDDLGFDFEIWNEMSFGSCFIHQRYYYDPLPRRYAENEVYLNVVRATAEAAQSEPALFKGVRLENGFSNTLPWPASAEMPARVTALSHHPYAGRRAYPAAKSKGTALDALGLKDGSGFVPAYEACFPEYFASALQTETIVRDMAPWTTGIYGVAHGRFARPGNPCWCWITEVNYAPGEDGVTEPRHALALKAKAISRYFCFYLNKGVERLYLYGVAANDARAGDLELGVLRQDFIVRTRTEKSYPADEAPWTSPALVVVRRIVKKFREGLDPALAETRRLQLVAVTDRHDHKQFDGDPSDLRSRPPLYDRDVFAFLPYQVSAKKFVVPCYVVTRDIRAELPEEQFTLAVKGFHARGAKVSLYDPIHDRAASCRLKPVDDERVEIDLSVTDYPRLLMITEP